MLMRTGCRLYLCPYFAIAYALYSYYIRNLILGKKFQPFSAPSFHADIHSKTG